MSVCVCVYVLGGGGAGYESMQQTWQYIHYLSCYSLVSSADTPCASLMLALVPASHIKHLPLEDKLRDAKEYSSNSKNGIYL